MSLGPIVSSTGLSKDKIVGSEDLSIWSRPHGIHGTGLKINKHSPGHILATGGLIVIYIDSLQLQVGVTMVSSSGVNAMLIRNDFPELERKGKCKKKVKRGQGRVFYFNISTSRLAARKKSKTGVKYYFTSLFPS